MGFWNHRSWIPYQRTNIVAHLLAAYDWYSALLHWSYLPQESRKACQNLPETVCKALEKGLRSKNESITIGLALARRLGHRRIYPIDSGIHGDLPNPSLMPVFQAEFEKSPVVQSFLDELRAKIRAYGEQFARNAQHGDLLPFFLSLNRGEALENLLEQWRLFFKTKFTSGLDQYAQDQADAGNARPGKFRETPLYQRSEIGRRSL